MNKKLIQGLSSFYIFIYLFVYLFIFIVGF